MKLLGLVCALLIGSALPALANDDLSPIVEHRPDPHRLDDGSIRLLSRVHTVSGAPIRNVTVQVRPKGVNSFFSLQMKPFPGLAELYVADLPANLVAGPLEYFIEAYDEDGYGPGRNGSPKAAYRMTPANGSVVVARPERQAPSPTQPSAATADPAAPQEQPLPSEAIVTALPPQPAEPDWTPTPPAPASSVRPWMWTAAGAGAVTLATGAVFGLRARSAERRYNNEPESFASQQEALDFRDAALRQATLGNVLMATGGVLLVGAGALFSIEWRRSRLAAGSGAGATLTVSGRF